MKSRVRKSLEVALFITTISAVIALHAEPSSEKLQNERLRNIQNHRENPTKLANLIPIVRCSFKPSNYESVLLTRLRDAQSTTKEFRRISDKIAELLVSKVIDSFPLKTIEIETPVATCKGYELIDTVELVSIMRSGDALLDTFIKHFPEANISKILIQRDEKTAEPTFQYMKIAPTIHSGSQVIITEPMIATGGSLGMAIDLLKEKGVREENITIASICVAPEGALRLSQRFPKINLVMTVMDEKLNEHKYIVPGLGDYGDRYFGTN